MNLYRMLKTLLRNLLLVIVSCGLGLLLCEAALRLQEPFLHKMARYNIERLYAAHPIWDHWPRPNFRFADHLLPRPQYPNPLIFRFNSYGCRDGREPQVPKPAGLRRILVMGDSFTEGLYEEDTLAAELQRTMDRAGGGRYEVMNCGSVSYSPLLHFLRLKHQLLNLAPDVVVMNIDLTDVYDDYWRYRPLYDFSRDGEPVLMHPAPRWRNRFLAWGVDNSYLVRLLYAYRARFLRAFYRPLIRLGFDNAFLGVAPSDAVLFRYHSTLGPDSEEWRTAVGYSVGMVSRIIDLTREHGVRLIVTTYPHKEQVRPDKDGRLWNREYEYSLERLCRERGVEFYSAFDGIRAAVDAGQQPVFWETDMHFTPEGQRIWGRLVSAYVLKHLENTAPALTAHGTSPR